MSMASTLSYLADRRGQTLTLTAISGGEHTVLGTVGRQTTTTMVVRAIVREVTAKMIDGVAILYGDLIVMVPAQSALTVVPKAGLVLATIDGVERVCKLVRSYRVSGTVHGYELVMRGSA